MSESAKYPIIIMKRKNMMRTYTFMDTFEIRLTKLVTTKHPLLMKNSNSYLAFFCVVVQYNNLTVKKNVIYIRMRTVMTVIHVH